MLSTGNADPQICVSNLLSTYKMEAFYGRGKGVTTKGTDAPFSSAMDQITSDAEEMLEEYEPRVTVNEAYFATDEDDGMVLVADIDVEETNYSDEEDDDE